MAAHSTLRLTVLGGRRCFETVHPWTRSCSVFYLSVLGRAALSTASVFTPLYCLPVVIKLFRAGVHHSDVRDALIASLRTTSYLGFHISLSLGLTCVFRALVGCYTQYTTALLPTMVASISFLLEDRKNWNIIMVMIGNILLEKLLMAGERETGIPLTVPLITCFFMVSSAALLYLLRRPDFRHLLQKGDTTWFFYPPSVKEKHNEECNEECNGRSSAAHEGFRKELKEVARLAATGFGLQVLRMVAKNVRRPATIARHLFRLDTYGLCFFFQGYIIIYKVCSWALRRLLGRDAAWHALPAGLLAGAALAIYPRRILSVMAATTALQLLLKWICQKNDVKHVSFWKFIFVCASSSYLVHSYFVNPDYCPIWFNYMLTSITGGMTEELRIYLYKVWHPANFPAVVGGL